MEEYGNFIDYLNWRGDLSFDKSPFNCVDALILSQLVYLDFDQIISRRFDNRKTIAQINHDFKIIKNYKERCILGAMINCETPDLLQKCADSERFRNVLAAGYKCVADINKEEQFAAVTFILNNKKRTRIVTYRGTDDTFLGWKEDFNMSYLDTIPSQKDALSYFNHVAKTVKGKFILAGHSKGGNDALYTAVNCLPCLKRRIISIYNFDGPGFTKEFFASNEFSSIKNKVYSYFPYFDIVGMLFEHDRNFKIIRSSGKTFMQHDPFSWNVIGDRFVSEMDFSEDSKCYAQGFNEWVQKNSLEEKKNFIDDVFNLLYESGATCNKDIENNKLGISKNLLSAYRKLDSEKKKNIKSNLNMIIHLCTENIPFVNLLMKIFPLK